jgi:phage repressor protein C with HTH and peptisase S24 domain
MSLGQIIRDRREQMGLTLDEVSGRIGFSKPYLSTIETGKVNNPPSDTLLLKLEKVLDFKVGSLLHIAHIERAPTDVREKYESSEAENDRLRRLLRELVQDKSQAEKASVEEALKGQSREAISAGRLVPIINKVSAGYPADFEDLDYPVGIADDYVRCPDLHDSNAFAVRVIGDSMEPNFKEGDIVVFSPAIEPKSGDDCFVRFASPHETMFKRVFFEDNDMVRLQPRNEKYAPTIVESKRINGMYRAIAKVEKL